MSGEAIGAGRSPVALDLTIPADERLLEAVRAVAARVAQQVGYGADEARAIGGAVGQAAGLVVERVLQRDPARSLHIRVSAGGGQMAVSLRCEGPDCHEAGSLETDLPVDDLRRVMPDVEIRREDRGWVCRLARPLPA